MTTNELRRGNLLKRKNGGHIIEVLGISENRIEYRNPDLDRIKTTWADIKGFEGVPITEENLISLGGVKYYDNCYIVGGNLSVCLQAKGMLFVEISYHATKEDDCGMNIECVHQLQNLYLPLTGQELQKL